MALGELYELGEGDLETVGLYTRTWMTSFEATSNALHLGDRAIFMRRRSRRPK